MFTLKPCSIKRPINIISFRVLKTHLYLKNSYSYAVKFNRKYIIIGGKKMGDIKTVESIPIKPFALMGGTIYALLAFIYFLIISVFVGLLSLLGLMSSYDAGLGVVMVFIFLIVLIIGGTIGAFIGGVITCAIGAFIYNFLASKIGGIKLELE
jgi:hypothetical protein